MLTLEQSTALGFFARDLTDRCGAVVFLGSSLPLAEARSLLEAGYLPPADRGAVHRCFRETLK
jgi:hypothetical protein